MIRNRTGLDGFVPHLPAKPIHLSRRSPMISGCGIADIGGPAEELPRHLPVQQVPVAGLPWVPALPGLPGRHSLRKHRAEFART